MTTIQCIYKYHIYVYRFYLEAIVNVHFIKGKVSAEAMGFQ